MVASWETAIFGDRKTSSLIQRVAAMRTALGVQPLRALRLDELQRDCDDLLTKVVKLETAVFGKAQDGALARRLFALEVTISGHGEKGPLLPRADAIEGDVGRYR